MARVLIAENWPANDNYLNFHTGVFSESFVGNGRIISDAVIFWEMGDYAWEAANIIEILDGSTVVATSNINHEVESASRNTFIFSGSNKLQTVNGKTYNIRLRAELTGYDNDGAFYVGVRQAGLAFQLYGDDPEYSVTYNGNGNTGGSVPTDSAKYTQGALVAVRANTGNLVRTNHTLLGWGLSSGATTPTYTVSGSSVSPSSFTMGGANVTLYAVWQQNITTYTLTYNGNGNTGGTAPTGGTYNAGSTVTISGQGTLTRTNHNFKGWTTSSGGSVQYTQGQTFAINSNTTLYAVWAATYTVTYQGNGYTSGSVPTNSSRYEQGQTFYTAQQGTMARSGYTFQRWNTNSSGTGTNYNTGASVSMPNGGITLYAVWQQNVTTYTLTYNGNGNTGGSVPTGGSYNAGATVTTAQPGTMVRAGYTFRHWNNNINGQGTNYIAGATFTMGSGNLTLYAVWQSDLGSGVIDSWTHPSNTPQFNFGNVTSVLVNRHPSSNGYASAIGTRFTGNGETIGKASLYIQKVGSPIFASVTAKIYAFNNNSPGTLLATSEPVNTANISSTAGWIDFTFTGVNRYKTVAGTTYYIIIQAVDGSSNSTGYANGLTFGYYTDVGAYNAYFTFGSWKAGGMYFVYIIYAAADAQYTVAYDANGGSGSQTDPNSPYAQGAVVTVLGQGGINWVNHNFKGWNTQADGSGTTYNAGATFTMGAGNVVLYAVWAETFSVTYNGNGASSGSVPVDNNRYEAGAVVAVLGNTGNLTRTNHTFNGFSTSSSATSGVSTVVMPSSNLVLYAVWTENPKYAVTYHDTDADSGQPPVDQNSPYFENEIVTVQGAGSLQKTGHTLTGWQTIGGEGQPTETTLLDISSSSTATNYITTKHPSAVMHIRSAFAEAFTGDGSYVKRALFNLRRYGTTSSTVNLSACIYSASGAVPNVLLHASTPIVFGNISSTVAEWVEFTFDGTFQVASGVDYYLVLQCDSVGLSEASGFISPYLAVNLTVLTGSATFIFANGVWGSTVNQSVMTQLFGLTSGSNGGVVYAPDDSFTMPSENVDLHPVWQETPKYTLSYDGNGNTGGSAPASMTDYAGTVLHAASQGSLVKTNYYFTKWNTQSNGSGMDYAVDAEITLNGNVVLYAVWQENPKYTVTYHDAGADSGSPPTDINSPYYSGSYVTVLGAGSLQKNGYTFKEWNTQSNGSGASYNEASTFVIYTNTDLYPVWSQTVQSTFTVTYAPGAHGTFTEQTTSGLYFGDPTPVAPTVTVEPGWQFTEWTPTPSSTVTGDATYTAQYKQILYTVKFLPGAHGTFTTATHSNLTYGQNTPAPPTVTSENGWEFTEWTPTPSLTVTENVEYTAQYKQILFTVRFLPGDHGTFSTVTHADLVYGDPTPSAPVPTPQNGYVFKEWSPVLASTVTESVDYTAVWTQLKFTVTYLPGLQGTFMAQVYSDLVYGQSTPAFSGSPTGNAGYSFDHWEPIVAATVTASVEYVAVWVQLKFTVRYLPGDHGTFTLVEHSNLTYGQATPAPPTVTVENGWQFTEWTPTPTATVTGDVDYVAQYVQLKFTVTYLPGSHGLFTPQTYTDLIYGQNTPAFQGATVGEANYVFDGWNPVPDAVVSTSMEYTAKWRYEPAVAQFTLTYHAVDADSGSPPAPIKVDENTTVVIEDYADLARTDYTPTGWLYIINDEAVNYQPGEQVVLTNDMDLHVLWSETELPTKFYYGCVKEMQNLCNLLTDKDETQQDLNITVEKIEEFLVMATKWVNGLVRLASKKVVLPFNPQPSLIHSAADLYAAGRLLQPDTPKEETHPYILEAMELMKKFLLSEYGYTGLEALSEKPVRRPVFSAGQRRRW